MRHTERITELRTETCRIAEAITYRLLKRSMLRAAGPILRLRWRFCGRPRGCGRQTSRRRSAAGRHLHDKIRGARIDACRRGCSQGSRWAARPHRRDRLPISAFCFHPRAAGTSFRPWVNVRLCTPQPHASSASACPVWSPVSPYKLPARHLRRLREPRARQAHSPRRCLPLAL